MTELLLAAALLASQDVYTVSADRATGVELEGGEVRLDMWGNVSVTDGEVTVTSDSGTVWQQAGDAVFHSNVEVVTDTLSGTSDMLEYSRETGIMTMTGNVTLTDGESVVEAREVVYFRSSGKAVATDSVVMTGPWLGTVEGEYAMYDRERGSLFVTVDPVLRRVEDGDSLTVTADRLEFLPDSNRAEAQGDALVLMPARELTATAEYLIYMGNDERFELFGSPVLTTPDGELSGDWMELTMDEGSGRSTVRVEGAASGHFLDDGVSPPSETWFDSESAYFAFTDEEPDSISIWGAASLTVDSGGEAAAREEMNTVRGDLFEIGFEDGSVGLIRVSGTVSGTYSYREGSI